MNTVLRFENALKWIKQNTIPNSGIAVTSGSGKPYCEVTGYLIPTLLNWQETELALSYGQWLVSCQHESGCWGDPDENQPYAFDTGQVIKGLLALAKKTDKSIWIRPIKKACEWIISHISETGKPYVPDIAAWDAAIPPAVLLYSLESVRWAGEYLNEPYWIEKIDKSVDWFLSQKELTRFSHLSHFYGYIMDALCDLGHKDRAAEGMEIIARIQERTGIIPAYPDVQWACSPGIFQLAGVWYKLGNQKLGDAAFGFGEELQNPSGGWFGSYGNNCSYFVDKEISWPVKFFMDTLQLKLKSNF